MHKQMHLGERATEIKFYEKRQSKILPSMSGNFCATNPDLYAIVDLIKKKSGSQVSLKNTNADLYSVVDLTKKKSGRQVSSKNKKSDIPLYHVLEQREDKSHKERENSQQHLSNNPQSLYPEIDFSKRSQKSITQTRSPQQIRMSSLNQSDKSETASEEDINKKKSLNVFMLLIIVLIVFFIFLLIIGAVTSLTVTTFLKLSTIETDLKRNIDHLDSEIEALHETLSSEMARNELKNELQDNATIVYRQALLKLSKDVQDINMSVNYFIQNVSILITFQNTISYSCSQIGRKLNFSNSSGYYVVWSAGVLRSVYCDLTRIFGSTSKGWMRVAKLDVNNCPPGMRTETVNTSTTCKVSEDGAGCTEIYYPVYNISYTQVTGRIRAYQLNTSDGFITYNETLRHSNLNSNKLQSNYIDGISISSNELHIWSLAAGCQCNEDKPMFIGSHYTCDGLTGADVMKMKPYQQQIWEHQQCGRNSTWFVRNLNSSTTDILVRVCRDQGRADEDLAIKNLELYVM